LFSDSPHLGGAKTRTRSYCGVPCSSTDRIANQLGDFVCEFGNRADEATAAVVEKPSARPLKKGSSCESATVADRSCDHRAEENLTGWVKASFEDVRIFLVARALAFVASDEVKA